MMRQLLEVEPLIRIERIVVGEMQVGMKSSCCEALPQEHRRIFGLGLWPAAGIEVFGHVVEFLVESVAG